MWIEMAEALTYYTGIYLKGLKKIMETRGQDIRCPTNRLSYHAVHGNTCRKIYRLNQSHRSLGAFTNWRKATISCVMSVRLSVRMEQLHSHSTNFHEI
jgi:hypothetical protein